MALESRKRRLWWGPEIGRLRQTEVRLQCCSALRVVAAILPGLGQRSDSGDPTACRVTSAANEAVPSGGKEAVSPLDGPAAGCRAPVLCHIRRFPWLKEAPSEDLTITAVQAGLIILDRGQTQERMRRTPSHQAEVSMDPWKGRGPLSRGGVATGTAVARVGPGLTRGLLAEGCPPEGCPQHEKQAVAGSLPMGPL
ncbi:hypothetical protein NDU88_009064 [Pleurodeles waltl]|uniref:Uncharacterized protein n=1 Tax=Pleurodeles waltl TaxID=8319 RepID=A0AAV7RXI2_PLEWA|nr:hypothetical protein NDU88_009064 [Pleurodeles waltl]